MKLGVIFTVILGIIAVAYVNANQKLTQKVDLKALHLQMTVSEVEASFGSPFSRQRSSLIYILEDSSQLSITLRDDVVASAVVKFHSPLKIEDPEMRKLTLVQMSPGDLQNEDTSWFFAGKPESGLIYKITQNGEIESLTWVPPFTYGSNQPKNLQVLFRDFKSQNLSNL
jgi:hypothetical protein